MAQSSWFDALIELNPSFIQDIVAELPVGRRAESVKCAVPELARQWQLNQKFDNDTGGRFMEPSDPATASSIFLTTATDIVSMGMLPGLAALLVR